MHDIECFVTEVIDHLFICNHLSIKFELVQRPPPAEWSNQPVPKTVRLFDCTHWQWKTTAAWRAQLSPLSHFLNSNLKMMPLVIDVYFNDQLRPFREYLIILAIVFFFLHHYISVMIKFYFFTICLRVRTVAKRHMRSSMFTASFILVSWVKLP